MEILARVTASQGWRIIGGVRRYYRSRWEANYARYLEMMRTQGQILGWEHEPEVFWFDCIKRGSNNYKPDFRVCLMDYTIEYHEVKGYMDPKSKTKIKRMAKYHPQVKLIVIDKNWFKAANKMVRYVVPGWES